MNMNKRPTSISVIAWILIVFGILTILMMVAALVTPEVQKEMAKNPIPIPIQFAMSFAGLGVMIVSGIGLLNCQNWARYLYVIWNIIGFVIGLITSPMKLMLIPGFLVFLIIAYFLFTSAANQYFLKDKSSDNAQTA
jgi:hypothetical protein